MPTFRLPKPMRPRLLDDMKPVYIPLKKEYFLAFKDGTKTKERRLRGKRWNFSACPVGRDVVLSNGYGNRDRLRGYIVATLAADSDSPMFTDADRHSIEKCYGPGIKHIFEIEIELETTHET